MSEADLESDEYRSGHSQPSLGSRTMDDDIESTMHDTDNDYDESSNGDDEASRSSSSRSSSSSSGQSSTERAGRNLQPSNDDDDGNYDDGYDDEDPKERSGSEIDSRSGEDSLSRSGEDSHSQSGEDSHSQSGEDSHSRREEGSLHMRQFEQQVETTAYEKAYEGPKSPSLPIKTASSYSRDASDTGSEGYTDPFSGPDPFESEDDDPVVHPLQAEMDALGGNSFSINDEYHRVETFDDMKGSLHSPRNMGGRMLGSQHSSRSVDTDMGPDVVMVGDPLIGGTAFKANNSGSHSALEFEDYTRSPTRDQKSDFDGLEDQMDASVANEQEEEEEDRNHLQESDHSQEQQESHEPEPMQEENHRTASPKNADDEKSLEMSMMEDDRTFVTMDFEGSTSFEPQTITENQDPQPQPEEQKDQHQQQADSSGGQGRQSRNGVMRHKSFARSVDTSNFQSQNTFAYDLDDSQSHDDGDGSSASRSENSSYSRSDAGSGSNSHKDGDEQDEKSSDGSSSDGDDTSTRSDNEQDDDKSASDQSDRSGREADDDDRDTFMYKSQHSLAQSLHEIREASNPGKQEDDEQSEQLSGLRPPSIHSGDLEHSSSQSLRRASGGQASGAEPTNPPDHDPYDPYDEEDDNNDDEYVTEQLISSNESSAAQMSITRLDQLDTVVEATKEDTTHRSEEEGFFSTEETPHSSFSNAQDVESGSAPESSPDHDKVEKPDDKNEALRFDWSSRRFICVMCLIPLVFLIVAIIALSGRKDRGSKEVVPTMAPTSPTSFATTPMDPYVPGDCVHEDNDFPHVLSQCECFGEISYIADDTLDMYKLIQNEIGMAFYDGTFDEAAESCSPANQALVWLSSGDMRRQGDVKQRYLLAHLYFELKGSNWDTQDLWLDEDDECFWFGIKCNQENVIESIDLENNNLQGTLPTILQHFANLHTLSLGQNGLTGSIPTFAFAFPELKNLMLNGNSLDGEIPTEVGSANTLRALRLDNNLLFGALVTEIGLATSLVTLNVGFNDLGRTIPTEIGFLTNLTHLSLESNSFTGYLPGEVGQLHLLKGLAFSNNPMKGRIPYQVFNLTRLEELRFSSTGLGGLFPAELANLTELRRLEMANNNFRGQIMTEFGLMTSLNWLALNDNDLEGTIPTELGALESVGSIALQGCALTGAIPSELGLLSSLKVLTVEQNGLTGRVPDEICNLRSVSLDVFVTDCFQGRLGGGVVCTVPTCCSSCQA